MDGVSASGASGLQHAAITRLSTPYAVLKARHFHTASTAHDAVILPLAHASGLDDTSNTQPGLVGRTPTPFLAHT
jgi:hypothetical protein